ncbi:MAG TPA: hypothetical protein DCR14_10585 [Acidimicrobiaceae bacterium]|nr:hypothetical protein [Acidimicrobiaceae bacterium]
MRSPPRSTAADRYPGSVLLLEFTIEPFHEGNPGPHVRAAVDAAEALGVTVEFGPFGSSCTVPEAQVAEVSGAVVAAAFANGASHVSLHAERLNIERMATGAGE